MSNIEPAIFGAICGAIVVMIGWIVSHKLTAYREEVARHQEAAREFLERQIQELYGPLLGLVQHGRVVYSLATQRLPTNSGKLDINQFTESDSEVWRYFIENHFHPTNTEIRNLIRTHLHLLDGGRLPASFMQLLKHEAKSEILYGLWRELGVDSLDVDGDEWPE